MTNDTKASQLQDARCSGTSSGTGTGRKEVRSCRRSTSPESRQTCGTRQPSSPNREADGCGGNRGTGSWVICSSQGFSLL